LYIKHKRAEESDSQLFWHQVFWHRKFKTVTDLIGEKTPEMAVLHDGSSPEGSLPSQL
jgi:hypothetical protein